MAERLELVTDFGALRAGMIVMVGPCKVCNGRHRGILTEQNSDGWTDFDGSICFGGIPLWRFLPRPICSGKAHAIFTELAVQAGKVYRVIDGLESSDQQTKEQPAPKKRERTA